VAVVVEGLNIAKRHTKPRQRTPRGTQMPQVQAGGILDLPQPLDISNVMLVCPSCGRPTRVKHVLTEAGMKLRTCAHCGQSVAREEKA
jgi:large subunit ribosomal protein L24